jgi:hypothetical protein
MMDYFKTAGLDLPPGDQHTNRAHCVAEYSEKKTGGQSPRVTGPWVEASYMHGSVAR